MKEQASERKVAEYISTSLESWLTLIIKSDKPQFKLDNATETAGLNSKQETKTFKSTKDIPSMPIGEYKTPTDNSYKQEVSKQYTVSVAYNKGAYQVIPRQEVKDIGK